jgi:hypothetical protein
MGRPAVSLSQSQKSEPGSGPAPTHSRPRRPHRTGARRKKQKPSRFPMRRSGLARHRYDRATLRRDPGRDRHLPCIVCHLAAGEGPLNRPSPGRSLPAPPRPRDHGRAYGQTTGLARWMRERVLAVIRGFTHREAQESGVRTKLWKALPPSITGRDGPRRSNYPVPGPGHEGLESARSGSSVVRSWASGLASKRTLRLRHGNRSLCPAQRVQRPPAARASSAQPRDAYTSGSRHWRA